MSPKERLSASVDSDLLDAARLAVRAGTAPSVSAWVNDALARQAEHDRRIRALEEVIASYEREHGEITEAEMEAAARRARARAVVVRPGAVPADAQ